MSDDFNQGDIDKLLAGLPADGDMAGFGASSGNALTPDDNDTLGELCNISMGAASTSLSEILGNQVDISSPKILEFPDIAEILNTQEDSTIVEVKYLKSLSSTTLLLLKNNDVAIMADLMMGGTGAAAAEVGELQLSAVGEAINQMMFSAVTNLSTIFNQPVEVSSAQVKQNIPGQVIDLPKDIQNVPIVGIVYKLTVGKLIDSELIHLMPAVTAKKQLEMFMGSVDNLLQEMPEPTFNMSHAAAAGAPRMFGSASEQKANPGTNTPGFGQQPVTIQPARFSSFDSTSSLYGSENQNLDLVLDVNLKLTVELGRSELPIKKVLELTRGSVIELDKVAGEPVDLLANGKLIAKGEVVVIEDNFGLRITSIISPADRLKNL